METVMEELIKAAHLLLLVGGVCSTIILLVAVCDHYTGFDPEDD